jgi:3-oxoadipate enol-lactonase
MTTELYHESIGQGEAVVFVHSGVTDSRMWDNQWQALANDYRLIRYDRPGFGKSAPTGEAPHSRADLLALVDKLAIEKAHFVGCSLGGEIITDFALEHPERVKSLVLVSSLVTGFEMQGEPPAEIMAFFGALQAGQMEEVAAIANRLYLVGEQRQSEQVSASLREAVYEMTLRIAKNGALMQQEAEALEPPAMQRLAEIRVPSFLIVGQYDHPEILRGARVICEAIAGARLLEIADTAHFPNMEAPEVFNQALAEFLAQVS